MMQKNNFDVIIIGGSYAGLSAAMALGRSLRNVLIIDSGNPCNKQTPHSHNFITNDGKTPAEIAKQAKEQVLMYGTVKFLTGIATIARKLQGGFEIETQAGEVFTSAKLLISTGVKDTMPAINGFAECWGISVLHCPYCHGYEVRQQNIGVIGNGDSGFEFCRLISNWSKKLTLFTNGESTLTADQVSKIRSHQIEIVQAPISSFEYSGGQIESIVFTDKTKREVDVVFARAAFTQHSDIAEQLGCEFTEQGYIKIDDFQRTNVYGVYAAGDNTPAFRAVSGAVAAGTKAGAIINKDLIDEAF